MYPLQYLMDQHALIMRMVKQVDRHMRKMIEQRSIDSRFIEDVVHFFTVYANVSHHGKEENILFPCLEKKPLREGHAGMVDHLVKEHRMMRRTTELLDKANKSYVSEESDKALDAVIGLLRELGNIYPSHIEEEETFFKGIMQYFSGEVSRDMENAFREYDAELDLEKYVATVEKMEAQ